jgi:hypothetical protein
LDDIKYLSQKSVKYPNSLLKSEGGKNILFTYKITKNILFYSKKTINLFALHQKIYNATADVVDWLISIENRKLKMFKKLLL